MATIGTFTKTDSGFAGAIQTLGVKATKVAITSVEKSNDTAPDFRIRRARSRSARPGTAPARAATSTSRSSWTTRASPLRSTPTWSSRTKASP